MRCAVRSVLLLLLLVVGCASLPISLKGTATNAVLDALSNKANEAAENAKSVLGGVLHRNTSPGDDGTKEDANQQDNGNFSVTVPPNGIRSRAGLSRGLPQADWSRVISGLRDPDNRGYLVALSMVASLGLCFFGHRLLRLWLFLGGFASIAAAFYLFAPSIFMTDACCGPGTERTHILISLALGVAGGLIALWILNIGIFLTGSCIGLGLSLSLRPLLDRFELLQEESSFATFYLSAAVLGGLLSLYREKPIVVFVTSCAGALGFCVGLSHFQNCEFVHVVEIVEEEITKQHATLNFTLSKCNRILAGIWTSLTIFGILVQYNLPWNVSGLPPPRTMARGGSLRSFEPSKELLVVHTSAPSSRRQKKKRRRRRDRDGKREESAIPLTSRKRSNRHRDDRWASKIQLRRSVPYPSTSESSD
eukprot:m.171597 g.171597  ORF g.171597 m.171597 type:complete len:421 (-) comp10391_c0_seq1:117-1379(-)